jgi:RNA polymerase sigma-70 factor (ECF subfamily)
MTSASPAPRVIEPAPVSTCSDEQSIRATLAGDARAFDVIIRTHQRRVYNFLYQFTRQRQDAEDLTQQTFLKAFHHLDRFDPRRPLVNWLLTIARHNALNHFRSAKNWQEIPPDAAGPEPSPARSAERSDLATDLCQRARALLSPREFEILWLRFGEDLSTEETARIVGLTRTHVKVLLFRARRTLQKGALRP